GTAADTAGDYPHPAFRRAHDLRQLGTITMGALQDGVDRVAVFGRVVVADRATRLHRRGRDAVDDEAALDDALGLREGGLDRGLVADLMDEADVAGAIVPDQSRARGECGFGRGDGRQGFVLD